MANQASRKIAEDFLEAYKNHDFESVKNLMHNDVQWTLPGEGAISGTAVGVEAVIERVKAIINSGVRTTLHYVLIGQCGVMLSLHNNATANDGRVLDEELATVLTVENGLIKKIDTYLSDVPMMERYFNKS
jgi:ketosteroid isomerase-like protein